MSEMTEEICIRAAREFLKNALLIDDQPFFKQNQESPRIAQKSNDGFERVGNRGLTADPVEEQSGNEVNGVGRTEVDAQILTEAFLRQGMVCGIYQPPEPSDEDGLSEFLKVCENVDVVIVDWHLNRNHSTEQAKRLIENILMEDLKSPRLRLICVYTSQSDLDDLATELLAHLRRNTYLRSCEIISDNRSTIGDGDLLKIVFANKGRKDVLESSDVSFPEADLPEWLVSEFAQLSRGLLRTACLGAVAAVRSGIPHLLSHFTPAIDGAYMGHRLMIPEANDSNSFLEGLICDELRNIVWASKAINSFAGQDASSEWLKKRSNEKPFESCEGLEIPLKWVEEIHDYTSKNSGTYRKEIIALLQMKLRDSGEGLTNVNCEALFDNIARLFFTDETEFMDSMLCFGELQSISKAYKKQMFYESEVPPALMQGSVVAPLSANGSLPYGLKPKYRLLCVQPPCDCVRMEANVPRRFPFLVLSPEKQQPTFVIDGRGYSAEFKPSNQVVLSFVGSKGHSVVRANRNEDEWIFKSTEFECKLVASLKPMHAQKATSALAARSTNIGFDEFEWLRIRSLGGR